MIQVIVKNSKTGSQYICKSASKTVKDIAYKLLFHMHAQGSPVFKQLYHGPKGIPKKSIWNTPMHELLDITITETPLDGRTRYAKQLPVYNVGVLAELTY